MSEQNTDARSLVYTKWNYKYYMVFAPKYRRKVFFRDKRVDDFFVIEKFYQRMKLLAKGHEIKKFLYFRAKFHFAFAHPFDRFEKTN